MAIPTRDQINRGRQSIQNGAPPSSENPVSVPNVQQPNVRNPFWKSVDASTLKWFQNLSQRTNAVTVSLQDTHANRIANYPAANYPAGSFFYETDRTVLYTSNGTVWLYLAGVYATIQANLPADLGASDVGFLVDVTDYLHELRWIGSGWGWAPGDAGSGYIAAFLANPGTGWAICGGTVASQLLSNGTTQFVTLPNYVSSPSFLQFGSPAAPTPAGALGSGAIDAAVLLPYFRR